MNGELKRLQNFVACGQAAQDAVARILGEKPLLIAGRRVQIKFRLNCGLRPTHNHDGRYTLVWAVSENGQIYRTYGRKGGSWRAVRRGERIPLEVLRAAGYIEL